MIRLEIICFLSFIIGSKGCPFDIRELNELKQLYVEAERRMEEATRDQKENTVIVLGDWGSDKSELINYLIGNELEAYRPRKNASLRIRVANNNSKGPEIVNGPWSRSGIPTKWSSTRPELQNLDIWYTSGFEKIHSEKQEWHLASNLYHLSRKVENLKFIFIINFEDIHTKHYGPLLKLLETLEKYLNGTFKNVFTSISVIVSNIPHEDEHDNQKIIGLINEKLQQILNSTIRISENLKGFCRYLINNNQRVALFRQPQSEGKLTSDNIDFNIISAVKNSESISKPSHQDIGLPISSEIEFCLEKSFYKLDSFRQLSHLRSVSQKWLEDMSNDLERINDTNTLNANVTNLRKIYNIISSLANKSDSLIIIQNLQMIPGLLKDANEETFDNMVDLIQLFDHFLKSRLHEEIDFMLSEFMDFVPYELSELIALYSKKLDNNNKCYASDEN